MDYRGSKSFAWVPSVLDRDSFTKVMVMIVPNSLVCLKEGAQGEEEEEPGGSRKGGLTGTPTPGADAFTGPTARNMKKHGR